MIQIKIDKDIFVLEPCNTYDISGWKNRTNSVLDSTEPANYTGSYTRVRKRIVDIEIAMDQSAATIITTSLFTDCTYSKLSSKFFTS